jgi:hypothetical protein
MVFDLIVIEMMWNILLFGILAIPFCPKTIVIFHLKGCERLKINYKPWE